MEQYAVVRTEKKYGISSVTGSILRERLSKVMEADRHSGAGGYRVRSLYFDSLDDDDFFDKVDGLERRKKIRLRIYSPDQRWVKLELKQKQGAVQVKKTLEISRETAGQLISGNFTPLLSLESGFPGELYQTMIRGIYRPKCVIEYRRTAFALRTNNTRITIDSDIRASGNCGSFFDRTSVLTPLLKEPVLEVKYNDFLPDQCKTVIHLADRLEISFSKYEMARRLIHG